MAADGLSSHTLLDWIPHWDYPAVPAIAALVLAVAVGLVALFCRPDRLTWWGVFWAVIPDLDVVLSFYGVIPFNLFPSHMPGFPHGQAGVVAGSAIQVLSIILFVVAARRREPAPSKPGE